MSQAILLSVPLGGLLGVALTPQPLWPDVSQKVPISVKTIAIDLQHSRTSLRVDPTRYALQEQDVYTAFYAWLGRLQVWSFPIKKWSALEPSRPLLILNPVQHYSEAELTAIGNFVRMGGTLCILDDGTRAGESTAPEVLAQFGLQYRFQDESVSLYSPEDGVEPWLGAGLALTPLILGLDALGEIQPAVEPRRTMTNARVSVTGGKPLMVTAAGSVVWARKSFGQGKVLVFTNSPTFHQLSFGDIWGGTETGMVRQQRYRLEYDLIQELWVDE